ncbi:helix-turn-helix domain-containing protein [Actinocorallia sp. B10E7]|uniref:TetR/AcrR family transcriptional regulator n=1 Tax=Actinocorallia sp. B10E7 TaxID=3153558 RepID=UPI00325EBF2A
MDLFARHGVSGTSLQMIADEIGVTKAAVYHQFRTKDEIVQAVIAPALDRLFHIIETAERRQSGSERSEATLAGLVDLVVDNRHLMAIMQSDPTILHLLRDSSAMQDLERHISFLLVGPEPDDELLVSTLMVSGGLIIAATDPRTADFDDDRLRHNLLGAARRLLRLGKSA